MPPLAVYARLHSEGSIHQMATLMLPGSLRINHSCYYSSFPIRRILSLPACCQDCSYRNNESKLILVIIGMLRAPICNLVGTSLVWFETNFHLTTQLFSANYFFPHDLRGLFGIIVSTRHFCSLFAARLNKIGCGESSLG